MPNLRAVADAVLEHPWTRGHLITWFADVPAYCALGAMLRAAGVAPAQIARAEGLDAHTFWNEWGPVLEKRYGLPNLHSAHRIVTLNDAARSRAEAAGLILTRMATSCDMSELLPPSELRRFDSHRAMLGLEGIFFYNGYDLPGPPSPLRPPPLDWQPGGFSAPAWRPKPWRPRTRRWRPA